MMATRIVCDPKIRNVLEAAKQQIGLGYKGSQCVGLGPNLPRPFQQHWEQEGQLCRSLPSFRTSPSSAPLSFYHLA